MNEFSIDTYRALHTDLVTTPGPSFGEEPRRKVLEAFFQERGVPFRVDEAGSLFVELGQGAWEETVLFDAHIDVVERGYAETLREEDGRLIGLGVTDDLAAAAMLALLAVALHPRQNDLQRPLWLVFSVGEEGLGDLKGIRQLVRDHPEPPHALICFDSFYYHYNAQAIGSIRFRTSMQCPGGHSWNEFGAPNAIDQVNEFLQSVKALYADLASPQGDHVNLSYNFGLIRGGEGVNSIARTADASYEFRGTDDAVLEACRAGIDGLTATFDKHDDVACRTELLGHRPAGVTARRDWIEPLVVEAHAECGLEPKSRFASTNINLPVSLGWCAICMGLCDGGNPHREDEYLVLDSLPRGWSLLQAVSSRLLGVSCST